MNGEAVQTDASKKAQEGYREEQGEQEVSDDELEEAFSPTPFPGVVITVDGM